MSRGGWGGCLSLPLPVRRGLSTTIPWWGTNLHCSSRPMHLGVHAPGPGAQGTSAGHRTLNIPEVGRGPLEDTGGRVRWRTQRPVLNTDHSERQSPDISPKYRRACSRQLGGGPAAGSWEEERPRQRHLQAWGLQEAVPPLLRPPPRPSTLH